MEKISLGAFVRDSRTKEVIAMHRSRFVLISTVLLFLLSCASGEENARTLYNQALFEQRDGNEELAKELLNHIVSEYPATEVATDADEQLEKLSLVGALSSITKVSRIEANEQSAISTVRNIASYQFTYYVITASPPAYAPDLTALAKGGHLGREVASTGGRDGYRFTTQGGANQFTVNADPLIPGKTGERHFFADESGVIRWSREGPAGAESLPVK